MGKVKIEMEEEERYVEDWLIGKRFGVAKRKFKFEAKGNLLPITVPPVPFEKTYYEERYTYIPRIPMPISRRQRRIKTIY